jgi:putative peptide zinc metalloprotease protein
MQLAQLRSIDLELEIADLQSRQKQDEVQLAALKIQRQKDPTAQLQIPLIQQSLETIQKQIEKRREDVAKLTLVSHTAGEIIPPPAVPDKPAPGGRLSKWYGTPLEKRNLNSTLTPGTLFCQIGDPTKFEAILIVDQSDIEMIRRDQRVELMLEELPGDILEGRVTAISPEELKTVPSALTNDGGGSIAVKQDDTGAARPASTAYQVEVPLDDPDGLLITGLKGQSRIEAGKHSLGWRLWRFIKQTFHFRM